MTALVITADALIAAACVAGVALLAWLLRGDHGQCFRPGDPLPDIPADAPIRKLAARIHERRRAGRRVPGDRLSLAPGSRRA